MAETSIEWTDTTWNPVSGCARASAGCDRCYAVTMTHRLESMGQAKYAGLTVVNPKGDRHFNGQVRTHDDALALPFKWRKPRKVFVNSMSDLFHRDVPFDFIDKVFAVMALTPQHTYQILTKRPERMAEYLIDRTHYPTAFMRWARTMREAHAAFNLPSNWEWPLRNVWLGTSVENQEAADKRIPHLLKCPAAVRFLSCEPLLSQVNLLTPRSGFVIGGIPCIDWIIVGGESGPGARPMHPDWARSLRDQSQAAGVAFFFKQWGEWVPAVREHGIVGHVMPDSGVMEGGGRASWIGHDGKLQHPSSHGLQAPVMAIARMGKKAAGRLLDGREWNEMPAPAGVPR